MCDSILCACAGMGGFVKKMVLGFENQHLSSFPISYVPSYLESRGEFCTRLSFLPPCLDEWSVVDKKSPHSAMMPNPGVGFLKSSEATNRFIV